MVPQLFAVSALGNIRCICSKNSAVEGAEPVTAVVTQPRSALASSSVSRITSASMVGTDVIMETRLRSMARMKPRAVKLVISTMVPPLIITSLALNRPFMWNSGAAMMTFCPSMPGRCSGVAPVAQM